MSESNAPSVSVEELVEAMRHVHRVLSERADATHARLTESEYRSGIAVEAENARNDFCSIINLHLSKGEHQDNPSKDLALLYIDAAQGAVRGIKPNDETRTIKIEDRARERFADILRRFHRDSCYPDVADFEVNPVVDKLVIAFEDELAVSHALAWVIEEPLRAENATLLSRLKESEDRRGRLEEALAELHHAVCGETGFAAAVRSVSGTPYPWPALDLADEKARALLSPEEEK